MKVSTIFIIIIIILLLGMVAGAVWSEEVQWQVIFLGILFFWIYAYNKEMEKEIEWKWRLERERERKKAEDYERRTRRWGEDWGIPGLILDLLKEEEWRKKEWKREEIIELLEEEIENGEIFYENEITRFKIDHALRELIIEGLLVKSPEGIYRLSEETY
jgi:hypothetical protein